MLELIQPVEAFASVFQDLAAGNHQRARA